MLHQVSSLASIKYETQDMTVDLTPLEKYNQLSESERNFLSSLHEEAPEVTVVSAGRQLELFEKLKNLTIAVAIFLTLCFLAYSFGLPNSILGFVSGVFAFFIVGMMQSILLYVFIEFFFLTISKFIFEKTFKQKFMILVEQKWADLKSKEKAALDAERFARQRVEADVARDFQKDLDSLVNYVAEGKSLLVPKSLFQFSSHELVEFAISQCSMICQQKNLTEQKRKEVVSYYRNVCIFLADIADDEIVKLEETLVRINNLMQDKNIQDAVRSDLLLEYARVSQNPTLLSSREFRKSLRYIDRFEEEFPSLSE
jgi:hypothetical protein